VRLKLLLSMHLVAAGGEHDVTRSPVSWAQMLGLRDPESNGARRIRDATTWLERQHLIRVERSRGKVPKCFLMSPLGDGQAYSRPSLGGRYVKVPVGLWHNGWIVTLTGTAIAMWLIIAELQGGRSGPEEVWVAPPEERERH